MTARVISAVVAALILIFAAVFFQERALYIIGSICAFGCIYEYSKMTLQRASASLSLRFTFVLVAVFTYVTTVVRPDLASQVAALCAIVLLSMITTDIRKTADLPQAFKIASAALVGLFYVGLFPGYAIGLLGGPGGGLKLFFGLLAIVFAGDTFAFFAGRFIGGRKLLESVSPKKTVSGAVGGLVGSAIAGFCLQHFFLSELPPVQVVLIAIASGAFGQVGDLFESLIKRLADTKDSGRIMPGHGGFLDRLDGILFAAPVYYVLLHLLF